MQTIILAILIVICPIAIAYDLLDEIAETISNEHIDKPAKQDFSTVIPNAVNTYLKSIDPYSKYLSATEYAQLKNTSHVGIGAKIVTNKAGILIIPFYQGPAFKAGINQPVQLLSVNGYSIQGMAIPSILKLFNDNDRFVLETLSDNITHISTVQRKSYILPSVQLIKDNINYIRINKFVARKTANELQQMLHNNLIIDLRETTGGDLYETLDCLSLILPSNKLLLQTLNNKGKVREYYSLPNPTIINKLVLLVSSRTASSAEIFAKALQYYQHALIVGQQTYGKCVSQTYIELTDGSALKLTNLKLFYPDGYFCNGKGLIPDIVLDDNQLYAPFTNQNFLKTYQSMK